MQPPVKTRFIDSHIGPRPLWKSTHYETVGSPRTLFASILLITTALMLLSSPSIAGPTETDNKRAPAIDPANPVTDRGIPILGTYIETDLSRSQFDSEHAVHSGLGRKLVDIETVWLGGEQRYSGIWASVSGTVHTLIQESPSAWSTFLSTVGPLDGRFLDVEVDYYGGTKLYSGLFYENGDDYNNLLHTTNSDTAFQGLLKQYLEDGHALIDFEAYEVPGVGMRYAGAWVSDPNQPRTVLYYDLSFGEFQDLLNPSAGRLIDFERYTNSDLGSTRYAAIFEMQNGGEQFFENVLTEATVLSSDAVYSDSDTFLIDLEPRTDFDPPRFYGVWGNNFKSLYETTALPADTNVEPLEAAQSYVDTFEALGPAMGIWAKNLSTGQTVSWNANQPFYLASTAKVPIHVKLWKEIQDFDNGLGGLDPLTTAPFTLGADRRDLWFVENRAAPGLNSDDFGDSFSVTEYDQKMMSVSDNAATSLLVDHPTIGVSIGEESVNDWLGGLPGVGQGMFPVTSIHDVDRTILWQGQVQAWPEETSYFLIAPWAFEPLFRAGADTYCDLACELGDDCPATPEDDCAAADYPNSDVTEGYDRYYNMGLNSASPKAFGLLLQALANGELLDQSHTQQALQSMTEPTPLDNDFPAAVQQTVSVRAKGGVKGGDSRPVSDSAIIQMGSTSIAMTVFTKDTGGIFANAADVRTFMAPIGWELLQQLGTDLVTAGAADTFSPTTVTAGQQLDASVTIENVGGAPAGAFDVELYASDNDIISVFDHPLGIGTIPSIAANASQTVDISINFPAGVPAGTYTFGWLIDPVNDVDEFDESGPSNRGFIASPQLVVVENAGAIFSDGFESGDTGAWSP